MITFNFADEHKVGKLMSDKEIVQLRKVLNEKREQWIQWIRSEVSKTLISAKMSKPEDP
jgi:hypothetical protein